MDTGGQLFLHPIYGTGNSCSISEWCEHRWQPFFPTGRTGFQYPDAVSRWQYHIRTLPVCINNISCRRICHILIVPQGDGRSCPSVFFTVLAAAFQKGYVQMRKDGTLCHCCQFHSLYNTVVLLWNGWHDRWGKISFGRKTSIPEIAENCIMAMEDISCHTVNVGFPHFLNCLFSRTSLFIRMIHFCSHQRYLYVNTSFLVLILIIIISQHWFLDCQPWPISLFLQGIMRLQSFRQKGK